MPDREKVKAELDEIVEQCRGLDYIGFSTITEHCQNILALLKDDETQLQYRDDHIAMYQAEIKRLEALLKEQEAIKPKSKVRHGANAQIQHFCGNCNSMLHGKPKFCSECGKGILW